MKYRAGYKYQLAEPYQIETVIKPPSDIAHDFASLSVNGLLTISKGYAWDGASGACDGHMMRGSLVHDVLYGFMREGLLPLSWRDTADRELCRICREDGMTAIRAWWVYRALKMAGEAAARPQADKILEAP